MVRNTRGDDDDETVVVVDVEKKKDSAETCWVHGACVAERRHTASPGVEKTTTGTRAVRDSGAATPGTSPGK